MSERESLLAFVYLKAERALIRACGKFGHLLTNVEEGHARCRLCRVHLFCSHASHEALSRYLLTPNTTSNPSNITVTYTHLPPRGTNGS